MAVEEAKDSIEAMPEYPPEIIDEAVERIQAQGLYSESEHEFRRFGRLHGEVLHSVGLFVC